VKAHILFNPNVDFIMKMRLRRMVLILVC